MRVSIRELGYESSAKSGLQIRYSCDHCNEVFTLPAQDELPFCPRCGMKEDGCFMSEQALAERKVGSRTIEPNSNG